MLAVLLVEPRVAVIVGVVVASTPNVVMVNVAVVAPAETTTVVGTTALTSFDERLTTVPPDGAGADKVIVPTEFDPP